MPALHVAAFAYDYGRSVIAPGGGRPRLHQTILTAWNGQDLRTAIAAYLRDRVPAAVSAEIVSAFEGAQVLEYVMADHVQTALAAYEAALIAADQVRFGASLSIVPMTPFRATQAIHLASAFSHGAPQVLVALSEEELEKMLERVAHSVRHLERVQVAPLPLLHATPDTQG